MKDYGLLAPVIEKLESWTVEDAMQATLTWEAGGGDPSADDHPMAQYKAWHQDLPPLQRRHHDGDAGALMEAVSLCGQRGLPMPAWCRDSFTESWRRARDYECRSLDEAFGYSMKGINLARAQEHDNLSMAVALTVLKLAGNGATVECAVQTAADEWGVSFARAREWYYAQPYRPGFPAKSQNPQKD